MPAAAQRALIAALCLALMSGPAGSQAGFLGQVTLLVPDESRFGGLSAIEMSPDGDEALLLSDRGTLFTMRLERDTGGIVAAHLCCTAPVSGVGGAHLPQSDRDSEGLARLPDGRMVISFEGHTQARIAIHAADGREVSAIPPIPGAQVLPSNGAFEGVAVDGRGRIYTLPESMPGRGPIPLLRFDGRRWTRFAEIPRHPRWSPVALDFDDRGRLYLLERRGGVTGFASRLSRFDVLGDGLGEEELLLQTPRRRHGNMEGLSLWRDASGALIATMVTDDNFLSILATTLVEYRLPD